jgi:transposase
MDVVMARAYSIDLRERVIKDSESGLSTSQIAEKFSVSPAWVRRLMQRYKAKGEIAPRQQRRRGRTPGWQLYKDQIIKAVEASPDATLAEYREQYNLPLSKSALARALIVLALPRKKSPYTPASKVAKMSKKTATIGR